MKRGGKAGYTLVEMTAVVATAAVLTAVMLPVALSYVEQGKISASTDEVNTIAATVAKFTSDTGDFPMRKESGSASASRFDKTILYSTSDSATDLSSVVRPGGTINQWRLNAASTCSGENPITDVEDTFNPHFYKNSVGYNNDKWGGPYLGKRGKDPWGHSYIVFLRGIKCQANNPRITHSENLWVISAGPNGDLETMPSDLSAAGDDVGVIIG